MITKFCPSSVVFHEVPLFMVKWVHNSSLAAAGNPVTAMVRRGFRAVGKHVGSSILGCLPPPLVTLTFTADHEMESVVGFCIDTWLFLMN